jgi:hypothetical protein
MSLPPVASFPPAKSAHSPAQEVSAGRNAAPPESGATLEASRPLSGVLPKPQVSIAPKVSSTYETPQDAVELHQNPETKDQIIIDYLDRATNVVMRAPGNGELRVERGIAKKSQEAAKLSASAEAAGARSEGGKNYGD